MESPENAFEAFYTEIDAALQPIIVRVQEFLKTLEGKNFGSVEANKRVAAMIQKLVSRVGMVLMCTKEGCGQPSHLRCNKPARSQTGTFQFEHFVDGRRTNHTGSACLPALTLVPKPADRRKKHA
jgi:hypothetical protein